MATTSFKGDPVNTTGDIPAVGSAAPAFELVRQDLSTVSLGDLQGKKVLNVFPSIDTPVCQVSVRTFNEKASNVDGVSVLNISADLPFAMGRFCGAENLEGVDSGSTFRGSFADDYGVTIAEGPLSGLCARAVFVLDDDNKVIHAELVSDIATEPNYDAALGALGAPAA